MRSISSSSYHRRTPPPNSVIVRIVASFRQIGDLLDQLFNSCGADIGLRQPPEEDAAEDDPRWELIRQLIEYKKFKEAAAELNLRALEQERMFIREAGSSPDLQEPLRLGEVGIFQLISAFQTVMKRMEARQDVQEIFSERFSVSEKIDSILQRVATGTRFRFSDLFSGAASRIEVVVTFLALLELIRLKQVRALQKSVFDEIEISAATA